jgi:hypothetical protein
MYAPPPTLRFWRRKPPIFVGAIKTLELTETVNSSTETARFFEAGTKSAAKEKTADKTSTSPGSDAHDRLRVETHSAINRSISRIECKSIDTEGDLLSY